MTSSTKLILVIGGTGVQGTAVVDALLQPSADGSPSPYAVRVLTRNPEHHRARALAEKGVDCVQGDALDFASVARALEGVYGAYVNTDSFTIGEEKETWAGLRIFEIARQQKVKHYVWSTFPYAHKLSGYKLDHRIFHLDGKARVADFMKSQDSSPDEDAFTWSTITTGFYMEMLSKPGWGPVNKRADGTYVFASALGTNKVSLFALADMGFFARYIFDHRSELSAKNVTALSDKVSLPEIVDTFTKVTGKPAVLIHQTPETWQKNFLEAPGKDVIAIDEGGVVTKGDWLRYFQAGVLGERPGSWDDSLDWVRKVNPQGMTLEKWMRETGYTGDLHTGSGHPFLKLTEDITDADMMTPDLDLVTKL